MTQAIAIAQVIMALLPTVTSGVEHLIAFVKTVRKSALSNGEWTEEMEQAFRAALLATGSDPKWKKGK